MKLKKISRNQIDTQKWDQTILQSYNGLVYHLCFYLDSISENWEAFVNDDYSIVVPISFKKYPGIKVAYQPFFSRQQEIISISPLNARQKQGIILMISTCYSKFHFCIGLLSLTKDLPIGIKHDTWFFQELPLTNIDTIRSSYSENVNRLLKKITHYQVKKNNNVDAFISFFKNETAGKIDELQKSDFIKLKKLLKLGVENGYGELIHIKEGQTEAYAYFWKFKNRITYLKGSVNAEGKKSGAMFKLFDFIIEENANKKMILDFGGSRIKSIASFFYKFNSYDVFYSSLTAGQLPLAYRLLKKTKAILKK